MAYQVWLRPDRSVSVQPLGAGYGRWNVPVQLLPAPAVCYCVGVGEDTQLDEALVAMGHSVHGFDPTPRAVAHAERVAGRLPDYSFTPVGIWDEDTTIRFYAPALRKHVSHSILNLQGTDEWFEGPVRRLSTVMTNKGHDRLDLLKLDIEGAEHAVLADLIDGDIRPSVLCVEFDQPVPLRRLMATSRLLKGAGYRPVDVDEWNVTWVFRPERSAPGLV